MAFVPVYRVGSGLYINLTNRCTNACAFCVREKTDAVGEADSLWLEREPETEEILSAFSHMYTLGAPVTEAVFCGFGEPTLRWDVLLASARRMKEVYPGCRIRLNTNGHANLIAKRDVTPDLAGIVDSLSVSLNAADAGTYVRLCRPVYGEAAFEGLLDFARKARMYVPEVVLSMVEGTADEDACRALARNAGLPLRVREMIIS